VRSTTSAAAGKSSRTRCLLTLPQSGGTHQSHWRLSVGRRHPTRSGWLPTTARSRCDHGSCRIMFLVCPLSVNPAPLLWRDPNSPMRSLRCCLRTQMRR
jgi:hypothetical protein